MTEVNLGGTQNGYEVGDIKHGLINTDTTRWLDISDEVVLLKADYPELHTLIGDTVPRYKGDLVARAPGNCYDYTITDNGRIIAVGYHGTHVSDDGGVSWAQTATWKAQVVAANGINIVASYDSGQTHHSSDSGDTWQSIPVPPNTGNAHPYGLRVFNGKFFLLSQFSCYCSDTGADGTWDTVYLGITPGSIYYGNSAYYIASSYKIFENTTASGTPTIIKDAGSGNANYTDILVVASRVIAVDTRNAKLVYTDDDGTTWHEISPTDLLGQTINAHSIIYFDNNYYLFSSNGLYVCDAIDGVWEAFDWQFGAYGWGLQSYETFKVFSGELYVAQNDLIRIALVFDRDSKFVTPKYTAQDGTKTYMKVK